METLENKAVSSVLPGRGTLLDISPGTLCRANFRCRSATIAGLPIKNIEEPVLFVIRIATREVQIAGMVPEPNERWMNQMARNLIDPWDGFLRSSRYLIHDRSTVFSEQFRQTLHLSKPPVDTPERALVVSRYAWSAQKPILPHPRSASRVLKNFF